MSTAILMRYIPKMGQQTVDFREWCSGAAYESSEHYVLADVIDVLFWYGSAPDVIRLRPHQLSKNKPGESVPYFENLYFADHLAVVR
jgi:hypothetical protein